MFFGTSALGAVLKAQRSALAQAFFSGSLSSLLVLAPVVYMFQVYGRVVDSKSMATLAALFGLLVLLVVLMQILETSRSAFLSAVGTHIDSYLHAQVLNLTIDRSLAQSNPVDLRPLQDLRAIRDFFSSGFIHAALEFPATLLFTLVLFWLHPYLGWVALLFLVAQAAVAFFGVRSTSPTSQQAQVQIQTNQRLAEGLLQGAGSAQAMGFMSELQQRWVQNHTKASTTIATAGAQLALFQVSTKFLQIVVGSTLLGLSAWLLLQNELWGGAASMIVASTLGAKVLTPIAQLTSGYSQYQSFKSAWSRLNELLQHNGDAPPLMSLPPPLGQLSVQQLRFTPPGRADPVLQQIQFQIEPGELLVIMGRSGSGKSTLARLLVGLWVPTSGKVRLDGAELSQWSPHELGPHLGYMPQTNILFEGTLLNNIARGHNTAQHQNQVQSLQQALPLLSWVSALPQQLHTPVGRDGLLLSGGQRQSVCLARAYFGQPQLVVLDEPTASLDESGLQHMLQWLQVQRQRGCTQVLITHQPELLAIADKVLLLQSGQQAFFGSYSELQQRSSVARIGTSA